MGGLENKNKIGRINEIVKKMLKKRFFKNWQGKIIVLQGVVSGFLGF